MGVAAQRTSKYSREHAKMRSLSPVELRVLILLLLCAVKGHGQTVEIINPTPPIIVPVGTNVTLQCQASGSVMILWQVNGTQLAGEVTQNAFAMQGIFVGSMREENGSTFSTITAHASLMNNQTRFVCQRSEGVTSMPLSSESRTMTVFGFGCLKARAHDDIIIIVMDAMTMMSSCALAGGPLGHPAPPLQLSVSPEATAVLHLHWDEPFSHLGENINFTLHSMNLRTGTVVRVEEVAETCITFERPEGDNDCDRYDFTVFSENQVGLSEPSATVTASFPSGPQSVAEVDISLTRDGGLAINLSFNGSESCQDYPATSYNITLNTSGRPPLLLGPFTLSGGAERITITATDGLLEDSVYSATVLTWNEYGTTSSEDTTFYTTDVQEVSVEVDGDAVTIVCTFLTGTSVRGCRIEFRVPMNTAPLLRVDIDRGNDSSRAEHVLSAQQLPADNSYQVLVYDLKADGRVGNTALMATVDIISVAPSTGTPASSAVSSLSPIATTRPTDTATLNPSQGLATGTLSAIIGASVAVVVLLLLILITVIVIITTCNMRQKRKARERLFLERQNPNELLYNMAYEQCNPTGLNAAKGGASLEANDSQDHAYDIPKLASAVPIAATAANPMYATSGGSGSPRYATQPIPVYEEVNLKEASVSNGMKVQQNISYGCLPEVTVDER